MCASLVSSLSKSFLKDVMKGISYYGSRSGTNREMAAGIMDHLEEAARKGEAGSASSGDGVDVEL